MGQKVWAEMVMGRNGHGPKWLWAEMTSDLAQHERASLSMDSFPIMISIGLTDRTQKKALQQNRIECMLRRKQRLQALFRSQNAI